LGTQEAGRDDTKRLKESAELETRKVEEGGGRSGGCLDRGEAAGWD
jgi:hypothetical protein